DLDQGRADDRDRAIVLVGLVRLDDDLVLEPLRVGQAGHLLDVVAGDAGRGAERQRGRGAGGHVGGLGPEQPGDDLAGLLEQVFHVDVVALHALHGLFHARRWRAAADDGVEAARVDDRPDAELLVDAGGRAAVHAVRSPFQARARWYATGPREVVGCMREVR